MSTASLDFSVADDTILLDQDIFSSSLGLGNISAGEFVIGTAAQDANDRIIYNSSTGALFYDNDGVGGNAAGPVRHPEHRAGAHQPRLPGGGVSLIVRLRLSSPASSG